jgi:hypothetical protein
MEIAAEYQDSTSLKDYIEMIDVLDLVSRLHLPPEGIRLAVDFFISNWSLLQGHYAPAAVGSCMLFAGYATHTSDKKTKNILRKKFGSWLSSMQACLYDIVKKHDIPVRYDIGELERIVTDNIEKLTAPIVTIEFR